MMNSSNEKPQKNCFHIVKCFYLHNEAEAQDASSVAVEGSSRET